MYEAYWKLTQRPFEDGPRPDCYVATRTHQAALLKLRYLVEQRKGIGLIAGEHGLGKTFLTHLLTSELAAARSTRVARLVFPLLNPEDTLGYLAERLGLETSDHETDGRRLRRLEDHLAQLRRDREHVVIVVDDAHLLDLPQLHVLRLLLNLHEQETADLSLVLSGRAELLPRLSRLAALDQRVSVRAVLDPLSVDEVATYVSRRLVAAGRHEILFDSRAAQTLWELSQGIPRRINQLCDLSLLVGFVDELAGIGPVEIQAAAEELLSPAA